MALDLSSKIAGIPVPVIGGVIGIGLVAVLYFQSANKSAAAAAPTTVAVPDLGPGDQVNTANEPGSNTGDADLFVSNTTWTAKALAWAVTQGRSPLSVQMALEKYMEGEDLSFEEGALLDSIIAKFGLPPQGVTGISAVLPKAKLPFKDPETEAPIPTPGTTSSATPTTSASKTPSYTSEFYDEGTGYTVIHRSDGTSLWGDQNKTYAEGTYMAGGNLYNADGTPANAQAQAVQDRINAMFAR